MNLSNGSIRATVAVAALMAGALAAGTDVQAADKRVGAGCTDVRFDAEFLNAYPRAPAACQEVVTKDGKKLVHFQAKVVKVQKDHFQLHFLDAVGMTLEPVATLTLLPQPGQTLRVNGKDVPYSQLRKGDKVDFWVPESAAGVYTDPNAAALSTIVMP